MAAQREWCVLAKALINRIEYLQGDSQLDPSGSQSGTERSIVLGGEKLSPQTVLKEVNDAESKIPQIIKGRTSRVGSLGD